MRKGKYRVFRVDSLRKTILPFEFSARKKHYGTDIKRLLKSDAVNHAYICDVEGVKMCVAADPRGDEDLPGFRVRGSNVITVGVAVLFGQGDNQGFVGCPADGKWLKRMIVWLTPKECKDEDQLEESVEA